MLRWLRREQGQELVEFALIVPMVLLLILAIAQFALVVLSYNTIVEAARQGTRFGLIGENADYPDRIREAVWKTTDTAGIRRADMAVTPVKRADFTIRVTITYTMPQIIHIVGPSHITLRAVSTKMLEVQ